MKKNKIFVLFCFMCLLAIGTCFAEEVLPPQQPVYGPLRKLGRGIQNISFGPIMQFGTDIDNTYKTDGIIAAGIYGSIKGIFNGLGRIGVGLYETLTFFIPGPEHYKPILNNPEFFLQTDPEFPENAPVVEDDSSCKQ